MCSPHCTTYGCNVTGANKCDRCDVGYGLTSNASCDGKQNSLGHNTTIIFFSESHASSHLYTVAVKSCQTIYCVGPRASINTIRLFIYFLKWTLEYKTMFYFSLFCALHTIRVQCHWGLQVRSVWSGIRSNSKQNLWRYSLFSVHVAYWRVIVTHRETVRVGYSSARYIEMDKQKYNTIVLCYILGRRRS